jgi:truncated hemoglobin YjbI
MSEMNVEFVNEMKEMYDLTDKERQLLAEMKPAMEKYVSEIVDAFYEHLEKHEATKEILHAEPGRIERLKGHLNAWLIGLTDGTYENAYFQRRYRIGARHVEVGLEPRYVLAAMAFCRQTAAQKIIEAEYADDPQGEARGQVLNKIMDLDLNIMLQSYDDKRIQQFLEVTGFSRELFEMMMTGE